MSITKPLLLGAALIASALCAIYMSATLYSLAPAGWMAWAAAVSGLILELFKGGLSHAAPGLYAQRRHSTLLIAVTFIGLILAFGAWAGNERFIHSIAADANQGQALHETRSKQIEDEISRLRTERIVKTWQEPAMADTTVERAEIADLRAQAKDMRARGALTKAGELESGAIAQLLAVIEQKEQQVAQANAAMDERSIKHKSEVDARIALLQQEQVDIASRTSKVVATDIGSSIFVLKAIVLVLEAAPIFIFWLYGSTNQASRPDQPRVVQHADEPAAETGTTAAKQVPEVVQVKEVVVMATPTQESSEEALVDEIPATTSTQSSFTHPKLDVVREHVSSMAPGESVTVSWLKKTYSLGGDTAQAFIGYLSGSGLITKPGKSWVRA